MSPFGTYPVSSATSRAKRGSFWTSSMTSGVRVASTQPAMPVPGGEARAEERVLALADDRLEDELLRLLVEQEDRRRLGAEDRARDLDDRGEQRAERLLRADDARGDGRPQIRFSVMRPPPTFVAVR